MSRWSKHGQQVVLAVGAVAPMSLLTYQDARPWARSIKQKVAARTMPPWYMDRTVDIQKFKNGPSLSDEDVDTIVKWVDAGDLKKPFAVAANGPDHHANASVGMGMDGEGTEGGGHLTEYAVAKGAETYPENSGKLIRKGDKLIMQLHTHSVGKEYQLMAAVGLRRRRTGPGTNASTGRSPCTARARPLRAGWAPTGRSTPA